MPILYVSNAATNGFSIGSGAATYAQMQSKATPALTLGEVFGNASLAAGDVIVMNTGDYAENMGSSGALQLTKNFVSNPITIQSWSGDPADVTIRGSGGQTYSVRVWQTSAGGYTFRDITFTTTAGASPVQTSILNCSGAFNGLKLYNCIIKPAIERDVDTYGILSITSPTLANWIIDGCTFDMTPRKYGNNASNLNQHCIFIDVSAGGTASAVTIKNSTFQGASGIILQGVSTAILENNIIQVIVPRGFVYGASTSHYGILIGIDATSVAPAANAYPGCQVVGNRIFMYNPTGTVNHGLVSGKGADDALWFDNYILSYGATFNFVIKGDSVKLYGNTQYNYWNRASAVASNLPYGLLPKGSQNLDCRDHVSMTFHDGFALHATNNTSDSGAYANKVPTGCVFTDCVFAAVGDAEIVAWEGGSAPSMTGCVFIGSLTDTLTGSNAVPTNAALGITAAAGGYQLTSPPSGFSLPALRELASGTLFTTLLDVREMRTSLLSAIRNKRATAILPNVAAGASGGLPVINSDLRTPVAVQTKRATSYLLTFFAFKTSNTQQLKTGATITFEISKDGGTLAATTNSVVEVSDGLYKITLTSTEMDADDIALVPTSSDSYVPPIKIQTAE